MRPSERRQIERIKRWRELLKIERIAFPKLKNDDEVDDKLCRFQILMVERETDLRRKHDAFDREMLQANLDQFRATIMSLYSYENMNLALDAVLKAKHHLSGLPLWNAVEQAINIVNEAAIIRWQTVNLEVGYRPKPNSNDPTIEEFILEFLTAWASSKSMGDVYNAVRRRYSEMGQHTIETEGLLDLLSSVAWLEPDKRTVLYSPTVNKAKKDQNTFAEIPMRARGATEKVNKNQSEKKHIPLNDFIKSESETPDSWLRQFIERERIAEAVERAKLSQMERTYFELLCRFPHLVDYGGNHEAAELLQTTPNHIGVTRNRMIQKLQQAETALSK